MATVVRQRYGSQDRALWLGCIAKGGPRMKTRRRIGIVLVVLGVVVLLASVLNFVTAEPPARMVVQLHETFGLPRPDYRAAEKVGIAVGTGLLVLGGLLLRISER